MCVEPLSVSVCWSKRVRSKSRTNCVHVHTIGPSMPGKREAFGRCCFNVGPRRIDGRPALNRHWFSVSCFAG